MCMLNTRNGINREPRTNKTQLYITLPLIYQSSHRTPNETKKKKCISKQHSFPIINTKSENHLHNIIVYTKIINLCLQLTVVCVCIYIFLTPLQLFPFNKIGSDVEPVSISILADTITAKIK